MQSDDSLHGVSVLVAGAGLAGLVAASDLSQRGAQVVIIEARSRPGGRVWTVRDGFAARQHAEAGGDLIDEGQTDIRDLAGRFGLKLVRILRSGFSALRGRRPGTERDAGGGWDALQRRLAPEIRGYRLAERRWDSASPAYSGVGRRLARPYRCE